MGQGGVAAGSDIVGQQEHEQQRAVEMVAPPVERPLVGLGQIMAGAPGGLPGAGLDAAGQDQPAGRLAVGLHPQGQELDRLAHRLRRKAQQRLGGPVAVAVVGPRRGRIGLARGQAGEAAAGVGADAGQGGVGALHGHAAQQRVRVGRGVAAGDMVGGLAHRLGHTQRQAALGLMGVDAGGDDQVPASRLDDQHTPGERRRPPRALADHRRRPGPGHVPPGAAAGRVQADKPRPADHQHWRRLGDEHPAVRRLQAIGTIDERPAQRREAHPPQPSGRPIATDRHGARRPPRPAAAGP